MSERKVLNKYYPPDFDPSKIPRANRPKNRQWTIRTMAPFNMRCNTCGEYIYKGKKFNARQEPVEDKTYLGLRIWRFYIKCPRCVAEISFLTDPENTDYALEDGATRNFEALRTAELMAEKEAQEKEDEEKNNPMKMLENRTKQSQREMDMLETLEDLRDLNARQARLDLVSVINEHQGSTKERQQLIKRLQEQEDEAFVKSVFPREKRLADDGDDEVDPAPAKKIKQEAACSSSSSSGSKQTAGSLPKKKNSLKDLLGKSVIIKKPATNTVNVHVGNGLTSKIKPSTESSGPTSETKSSTDPTVQPAVPASSSAQQKNTWDQSEGASSAASVAPTVSGLGGLIGDYSSSDSESNDS